MLRVSYYSKPAEIVITPGESLHYISWAHNNSMAFSFAILLFNYGIPELEIRRLFDYVNYKRETGTLYPQHNVTILPEYKDTFKDEDVYAQFHDAMKAQNQLIKANCVVFDMRSGAYSGPGGDFEYLRMLKHNLLLPAIIDEKVDYWILYDHCASHTSLDDLKSLIGSSSLIDASSQKIILG